MFTGPVPNDASFCQTLIIEIGDRSIPPGHFFPGGENVTQEERASLITIIRSCAPRTLDLSLVPSTFSSCIDVIKEIDNLTDVHLFLKDEYEDFSLRFDENIATKLKRLKFTLLNI